MEIALKKTLQWLGDSFYPRHCALPECSGDGGVHHLCHNCRSQIGFHSTGLCERCGCAIEGQSTHSFICGECLKKRPHFDRARSVGHFSGVLRELVHAFKYNGALWLKEDLCDLLCGSLEAHFEAARIDLVLPVPLHRTRQRERSYNQAALLAQGVAQRIERRYEGRILLRKRATRSQTRLTAAERHGNLLGAFGTRREAWLRRRCVLLVDDVMTTGATVNECARTLKKGGAATVWVLTLARGL